MMIVDAVPVIEQFFFSLERKIDKMTINKLLKVKWWIIEASEKFLLNAKLIYLQFNK